MPLRLKEIETDFSTADSSWPKVIYENGNLNIEYTDWREQNVIIRFSSVVAYRWTEEEIDRVPADDRCFLVQNADWFFKVIDSFGGRAEEWKHYKICFNEAGILDVICDAKENNIEQTLARGD